MELVHQVRYSLPHSRLCAAHLPTLSSVGCLGSAADEVVEPVAEPLDAAEGVVAELAAVGFGKVREKGANAGVERHYAITAWGLNVALRRVRDNEPVSAALLYQSAFLLPRRDGLSHPQRSENGVIDAVLRHGVVRYVAGLLGVLAAAVAELGECFVGSLVVRRFRYSLLSGRGVWCGGNVGWHFPVCRYDQGLRHVTTLASAEWLVVHGIHVGVGLFVG